MSFSELVATNAMTTRATPTLIQSPITTTTTTTTTTSTAQLRNQNQTSSTRRAALLLLVALPLSSFSSSSSAFAFGIPGPKEMLKEQKKKSARFVLAPIEASRQILLKAQLLLSSPRSGSSEADAEEVRQLLGSAARDCVPRQRSSLVEFQSRTGVEVCTFSLILKNAASLLGNKDPVKVETEARLGELIRSFSDLGTAVDNGYFQFVSDREKMEEGLVDTISKLDKFERGIKDCLGIETL